MTYQQFVQELQKKEASQVCQSLETVRKAIRKCSSGEQERMKAWAESLDRLTTMSEGEYNVARAGVLQGLSDLIADYRAPGELFAEEKTRKAMEQVFAALELDKLKLRTPGFTEPSEERAREAIRKDPLEYAAQLLAFRKLGEEASPAELFRAAGEIPLWKKDRTLQHMMRESGNAEFLSRGDTGGFLRKYREEKAALQSQTSTFKEASEEIARRYREDHDYALLERRMKALRALTEDAVKHETDPVKRSRLQEQTKVYMPSLEAKVAELEREERLSQTRADSSEAYQRQLAESSALACNGMARGVREAFGAEPGRFQVGDGAVSSGEFASLAALAMFDPEIGGRHAVSGKGLIGVPPDENVSIHFHSRSLAAVGRAGMEANGPDPLAKQILAAQVMPAREKVEAALEAYQKGEKAPLAQIIAYGVRCGVEQGWNMPSSRPADPRLASDEASPLRLAMDEDRLLQGTMLEGALELLERDPELVQAVRKEGLTEEEQTRALGFRKACQIVRAGDAALEKIKEAASGGEQLSGIEKEECTLAAARRNALLESLRDYQKKLEPRIQKVDEAFAQRMEKLEKKYGAKYANSPEAIAERQAAEAFRGRQLREIVKTPPIYQRLGAGGMLEADSLAQELRLGREKAAGLDAAGKLNEMENELERLRKLNPLELAAALGASPQSGRTTAQDVYNELTKDYKAGKLNYELYELRLRTMREMTGGSKQAKIDLKTVSDAVDYRLQKSAEKLLRQMTGPEAAFGGDLGERLRGIYDVYGLTPRISEVSLRYKGYSRENFSKLKDMQAGSGETHLQLPGAAAPIDNDDFAVLAAAATQADPKLGAVFFVKDQETGKNVNAVEDPTAGDAIAARTAYLTDAYQGAQGARVGFGAYLEQVIVPAREKADEALRQYDGGKGSPEELGKLLGLGLRNMVDSYLLLPESKEILGDCALEAAISGRLAGIVDRDPALKKEALKYASPEDLETARGLKTVYDFTRAAKEAMKKLETAAESKKPLSEAERRACIELVLQQKAMVISAKRQASEKDTEESMQAAMTAWEQADKSTTAKSTLANMKLSNAQNRAIGIPDYVRVLGTQGPGFARELLDKVLPGRAALFAGSDAEVVKALRSKIGSRDDPFQNPEYQKPAVQKADPAKALREREFKAPQAGGKGL